MTARIERTIGRTVTRSRSAAAYAVVTVVAVVGALALSGCGGPRVRTDRLPADAVVESIDDEALLVRAAASYDAGRYEKALDDYDLLLQAFPDSPLRPLALYNGGLALEGLERYEATIVRFEAYLETGPRARDAIDARFHIGACLERLERWDGAARVFLALLEERLPAALELEAGARASWSLLRTDDIVRAERRARAALTVWRDDAQLQAVRTHSWAALASFVLGEVYRELTARVPLRLPHEQLTRDLREKSALFVRAEERYLATLRLQHRDWSPAAGYRLGRLYEQFHDDLLAAEIPPGLHTVAEKDAYQAALRGRILTLVEKARIAYEKTVELSARMGVQQDEWARKATEGLDRMDSVLRGARELEGAARTTQ